MVKENKNEVHAVIQSGVSDEIMERLKKTVFGTPGKLRYQQTAIENNMKLIDGLKFITIKKRDRLLGIAGVVERQVRHENKNGESLYIRYLSVLSTKSKESIPRSAKRNNRERNNNLRSEILKQFKNQLEAPFHESKKEGVYYAYVEEKNVLSRNLCESFGFEARGKINTFLFSRFFPKKNSNVKQISEPEAILKFKTQSESFYNDHSFYFDDSLTGSGTLYGYFENGEMIAGCRVHSVNWKIIEIPGFSGFLMRKVFPKLPLLKRLFNAENLRFLTFDHIWYNSAPANKIEEIFSHLCSEFDTNLAMIWSDESSKLSQNLLSNLSLGTIHKVQGIVKADVMTRAINMDESQERELAELPLFVSAIDMT